MIIQLDPPIPLSTPKGKGLAWILIDYGAEHNLMWVVALDDNGEIWTFQNPEVRAQKNITMNRSLIMAKAKGFVPSMRREEKNELKTNAKTNKRVKEVAKDTNKTRRKNTLVPLKDKKGVK